MGTFLLFLIIIIITKILIFNCGTKQRKDNFCLSSQIKVVSTNKRRWCLLRVVISNALEWKKYTNQVRNKTCLWKCWECGKLFHPYKGFESTSHFCCVDCSNKYWDREQEQGIRHVGIAVRLINRVCLHTEMYISSVALTVPLL